VSLFADWWGYKLEAFDAIPQAAALMHEAGVSVTLKSDDNELMRHMYQEAAKTIKYGGLSEAEALKTITLNAAKQLGMEKRTGSIEVGKDADLALFNGHPLNSYARCELTLVDGEVYFQRPEAPKPFAPALTPPARPRPELPAVAANPQGHYVLDGVTLHPADGPVVPNAVVEIKAGKIVSTQGKKSAGTRIDGHGLHLYPGMIDAGTAVGLTEIDLVRETNDFREGGEFQPDLRASTGVNPDSEVIPVTRANGVLTVVTQPFGGVIAGQGALINLSGWTPREMTLRDPLALHIQFPAGSPFNISAPGSPFMGRAVAKKQRDEKVKRLKELFAQARAYHSATTANPNLPTQPRLAALIPYLTGQKPVMIEAYHEAEMRAALTFAKEEKLRLILSGGHDAWKLTDVLKKADVPVVLGPVMALPNERHDPYDAAMSCPAKLHAAGIKFCIRSVGGSNARNLPYEAAMAVSYGLPADAALQAVTLWPAQIFGVGDELGSVTAGKRANLVLTNGDLLQASTQVLLTFIEGKPLPPTSKQTRLYERYRERLRDFKDGKVPLGTK
jgi:imidazolonepropionase-like amidohydrolase